MFIQQNPNYQGKHVGDCTVRALAIATGRDWESTYMELAVYGLILADMPSANEVWYHFLRQHGFKRYRLPDTCPDCYTVRDFAKDHPCGVYVLGTGTHAVAVVNGSYVDDWDSGTKVPVIVWKKEA